MRKAVIEDCWGVRWTVRARYDRRAPLDSDYNRRNPGSDRGSVRHWGPGPARSPPRSDRRDPVGGRR